jgi:predicted PurR-regulated permease PerM
MESCSLSIPVILFFFLKGGEHIREKSSEKILREIRRREDIPPP